MQTVIPTLSVADMSTSLRFYKEALGFDVTTSLPGADGEIVHASVKNGDVEIMMGPAGSNPDLAPGGVGNGVALYMSLTGDDDVDALFERAKSAGARVLQTPVDEFWGDRIWSVADPDGYRLVICKQTRVVSQEEMAEIAKSMAPAV